jgi:hypothetical protein
MGKLEQLSIGAMDKKRDFCRKQVFHGGNFLELKPEKSGEMHRLIGSIPAHISYPKIDCLLSKTEVLLRQRL